MCAVCKCVCVCVFVVVHDYVCVVYMLNILSFCVFVGGRQESWKEEMDGERVCVCVCL